VQGDYLKIMNRNAFTLMELMVTVIIIGIVAAFGIPNYTRSTERAAERDAVYNIKMLMEAYNLYVARQGGPPPANLNTTDEVNTTFSVNIIEQSGNTYKCYDDPPWGYTCEANNTDGWSVHFEGGWLVVHCGNNPDGCPTRPYNGAYPP